MSGFVTQRKTGPEQSNLARLFRSHACRLTRQPEPRRTQSTHLAVGSRVGECAVLMRSWPGGCASDSGALDDGDGLERWRYRTSPRSARATYESSPPLRSGASPRRVNIRGFFTRTADPQLIGGQNDAARESATTKRGEDRHHIARQPHAVLDGFDARSPRSLASTTVLRRLHDSPPVFRLRHRNMRRGRRRNPSHTKSRDERLCEAAHHPTDTRSRPVFDFAQAASPGVLPCD